MKRTEKLRRAALAGLACVLLATPVAQADEQNVEAFSAWKARGQIFPTGPSEVTFVGVLSGLLIVYGADQSVDMGEISCPAAMVIDPSDGTQIGHAKCVIVNADGERIYGAFSCEGFYGVGCDGEFFLTGGTGDKAGLAGGGQIRIRGVSTAIAAHQSGNLLDQETVGVAVWPSLYYRLP